MPTPIQMLATIRLHSGQTVTHQGSRWTIIDVLADGTELVLEAQDNKPVQPDQHGHGHRRTAATVSLPLLDEHGGWHPQILALGLKLPEQ